MYISLFQKKIDRMIKNQAVLNNNIMKNVTENILDVDGAAILPQMT